MLKVNAPANVGVKLRNDYEPVEGEPLTWKLPDLAFAAEAWAVLELDIPATDATDGEPVALPITVSVRAATQDSAPLFLMTALSPLPVVGRAAWQSMPADELVARRVLELDAGDALEAVRVAIEADNWGQAQKLVDEAATRFAQHEWAAAIIATMRRLIGERDKRLAMKEAAFCPPVDEHPAFAARRADVRGGRGAVGPGVPAPEARAGEREARVLSGDR